MNDLLGFTQRESYEIARFYAWSIWPEMAVNVDYLSI